MGQISFKDATMRSNTTKYYQDDFDDIEIISQIIDGDTDSFELILNKYSNHIVKILKRHLPIDQVEEIAQEVFIKVYQSLPNFKNDGNFKHWISSIAVRTCYDFWRKYYRSKEFTMSSLCAKDDHWVEKNISELSGKLFHEESGKKEAKELLEWALSQLSSEDRIVIELVYLEGLSGKEAANLLGWSVANVKIRSFRSKKKLYKMLKTIS